MSIVKKQHYVWRHYLRPWANNENLFTYFKQLNKIERTSLMGIAQERYFYRLVDFSDSEETFLKNYIEKFSPAAVKDLNFDFLTLFTSTSKLKKQLEKTTNPKVDKVKYEEEIRKMEINLMEIGHGKMEALGHKLISYRSLEDLKTIEQEDYIFEAIMFLCFQYFRTKNMRSSVMKQFSGTHYEALAEKSWNILSYVIATTVAKNIALDPNLKFIFHENTTIENFLTCDQPVFNILNDIVDASGEVQNLELYYPLSPKYSLTLHFRTDQTDKFVGNNITKEQVDYFNQKVMQNADFYVFSNTKEQLEELIK